MMDTKMRAWVRRGGDAWVDEVAVPTVSCADDVIIEVALAGICRTDLYAARGLLSTPDPLILGHEFSGMVVAAGPDAAARPGDRVAVMPVRHCGRCDTCRRGMTSACPNAMMMGVDLPGAFARYARSPDRFVYDVGTMSDARAAYAEPVAASLAPTTLGLDLTAPTLVVGASRVASLTARAMRAVGHEHVEVLDVPTLRRSGEHTDAWPIVVETSTRDDALDAAVGACSPGGVLVLKSRPHVHVSLDLRRAVQKELTLQGAHYAPFSTALELLADPGFDVDDLLGASYPLASFLEVAERGGESGATKSFLDPSR